MTERQVKGKEKDNQFLDLSGLSDFLVNDIKTYTVFSTKDRYSLTFDAVVTFVYLTPKLLFLNYSILSGDLSILGL